MESHLQELPELPKNPELEVRQGLGRFTDLVKRQMSSQEFTKGWRDQQNEFSAQILRLKPIYRVKPPTPVVIDICDESVVPASPQPPQQQPSARHKRLADENTSRQTPNKRTKIEDSSPAAVMGLPFARAAGPFSTPLGPKPNGQLP